MIQVRDIFGEVVDVSKPIKRTRTRPTAVPQPVESRSSVVQTPVKFGSDTLITKLMTLTRCRTFQDAKKDEELIARRISEIQGDKKSILRRVEQELHRMPYSSVYQTINIIEHGTLWHTKGGAF